MDGTLFGIGILKEQQQKTYDCRKCNRVHDTGIKLTCAEFGQYLSKEQGHEVSSCLLHMSDPELDDIIADSMEEKWREDVNRKMLSEAKVEV